MPTATEPKRKTRPTKKVATGRPAAPVVTKAERGQIQIRLPQDLIDRLDVEAERRRVSKTFLVEQMISSGLARWEEQEISAV